MLRPDAREGLGGAGRPWKAPGKGSALAPVRASGGGGDPRKAVRSAPALAPVWASEEWVVRARLPEVLRPSAREGLGGTGNPWKAAGDAPP